MSEHHKASCQCGASCAEMTGAPKFVGVCHCDACRRATGGAYSTWVGFNDDQVRWLNGKPAYYASSRGVKRGYCAKCGTPLTYAGEKWAGETHFLIGVMEHPANYTPQGEVFADEALAWAQHIESKKQVAFEAVIFDFGGVFTTSPVQNFAEFEREHNLPEKFIGGVIKTNIHNNAWAKFERSEMTLEAFDAAFAEESRAAGFEIRGKTLVDLLKLHFHHAMIDALARVKAAGYRTGCITNNLPKIDSKGMLAPGEMPETVERIHANFDHIIESSKAGVRKPEPRIYEMMCEALSVSPDACIFLDDLGVNLKPARAMGMTTIKVPIGDVAPAIKELEALLFS